MVEKDLVVRKSSQPAPDLISAVVIGYSVGIKTVIGHGAQALSNIAGKYVGKEICYYFKDKIKSYEDVEKHLSIFANLKIRDLDDSIVVEISKCKICPKKVAKYDFEGTACPWGGILMGVFEECFGYRLSMNIKLQPGEICTMTFKKVKND